MSKFVFISRYNYFVENSSTIIGYNARTGRFCLISQKAYDVLRKSEAIDSLADRDDLIQSGFLHFGDEIELVEESFQSARKGVDNLSLTLTPTLACNFSCEYCFQNGHRKTMYWSEETRLNLKSFLRLLLKANRLNVSLTWYGGEPLLAHEIVIDETKKLRALIESCDSQVADIDIITNGILLDGQMAKDLAKVGVKHAQISIDSWFHEKPKLRGVVNRDGSPSIILKNARKAAEFMDVVFRVNVSPKISQDLNQIVQKLTDYGFENNINYARVDNYDEDRSDTENLLENVTLWKQPNATISRKTYAEIELDAFKNSSLYFEALQEKLTPKTSACSATSGNFFVIDANGDISRCWASVGISKQAEGNVNEIATQKSKLKTQSRWLDYSPLAYDQCRECKVLPLCMGGCSYPRLFRNATKSPCSSIREQIDSCVNEIGSRFDLDKMVINKCHPSIRTGL